MDGSEVKSSDLNSIDQKAIDILQTLANSSKKVESIVVDTPYAKCEQKKLNVPKTNGEFPLSNIGAQLRHNSAYQGGKKKKLKQFSAQ